MAKKKLHSRRSEPQAHNRVDEPWAQKIGKSNPTKTRLQFGNPEKFAAELQEGKQLENLYAHAQERQRGLVRAVLDVCNEVVEEEYVRARGGGIVPNVHRTYNLSDFEHIQHEIRRFNHNAYNRTPDGNPIIILVVPELKTLERAREKWLELHPDEKDASKIKDVVRLRILPDDPVLVKRIMEKLVQHYGHHRATGWNMRPEGYMDRSIYLDIDGYSAAVQFMDPRQGGVLGQEYHEVYKCHRSIVGADGKLKTLSQSQRAKLRDTYNNLMVRFNRPGLAVCRERSLEEFQGVEALRARYNELLTLQFSMHIAGLRATNAAWQERYIKEAPEMETYVLNRFQGVTQPGLETVSADGDGEKSSRRPRREREKPHHDHGNTWRAKHRDRELRRGADRTDEPGKKRRGG